LDTLNKRSFSNTEENSKYQISKLSTILEIAFSNIKYYERFKFNTNKFTYSDFQQIPVLTKQIIRSNTQDLVNLNFKKIEDVICNTSGGSTGEPIAFFQTKEQASHGLANYFLALNYNGVNINQTSVNLWGAERDMYNIKKRFDIRGLVHNKTSLNTFVLSDDIMHNYIQKLKKIKPKFIKAYVHSIHDMSKIINKHNINITFTPIIQCTTGPLYPEMRNEIKKAFNQAIVFNFYGSREVTAIATEIRDKPDMHILYDNVLIEILDENNNQVKQGEEGEIVVTTLNNFYMPLLRYKIGDRAVKGDDLEFGTLKLESVVGRTIGVIHKEDGSRIDGQFFTTLFFNKEGIKNFQLVQKTISDLQLKIVKSEKFEQEELSSILNRIKEELINTKIDVVFCDKIDLTSTGKIMYVYSEIS
jgi:phenylacetate-CoA ligase